MKKSEDSGTRHDSEAIRARIDVSIARQLLLFFLLLVFQANVFAQKVPDRVTIQLKWFHSFQFAGYYAALEKGYYADEGLDVKLRQLNPEFSPLDDVLAGRAQYGITDTGLVLAAQQGTPVVLVAQIFQHSPLVLVTLTSSDLHSPHDLAGKRISAEQSGITDTPVLAMLKKVFKNPEKANIIPHSYRFEDLIEGKTDALAAYATDQPFFFTQQGINTHIINPRHYGIDFYGDNLFTLRKELDENPGRVERIRRATLKGWHYALDHPDEIIDLILKRYNTQHYTRAHLEFQARETPHFIHRRYIELGSYEQSRFTEIAEMYADLGLSNRIQIPPGFFYNPIRPQLTEEEKHYLKSLGELRVPVIEDEPPLSFVEHGVHLGYLNELAAKTATALDLSVRWIHGLNYSQSLSALKRNKADLLSDFSQTEHSSDFAFSTSPVLNVPFVAVGRRDSKPVKSVRDLQGYKLVMVSGYQQTRAMQKRFPDQELILVDNIDQAYRTLRQGSADYYIDNAVHADYFLIDRFVDDLAISGVLPSEELGELSLSFGIGKKHPLLLSAMEKTLKAIGQKSLKKMARKWQDRRPEAHQISMSSLGLTATEKQWLQQHTRIEIGVMNNWPPLSFQDQKLNPVGISADLIAAMNKRLDGALVAVPGDWKTLYDAVKNKKLDALMDITPKPGREADFKFTRPYLDIPHVIVARKGHAFLASEKDLKDQVLALEEGFGNLDYFAQNYPEIEIKRYANTSRALDAVARGEADAYAGNRAVATYLIERELLLNLEIQGRLHKPGSILAIGTSSNLPILRDILQKILNDISEKERQAILRNWTNAATAGGQDSLNLLPNETAWLKEHPLIRVALDPSWAPVEYQNEAGTYEGISLDYLDRLEKMLGIQFEVVPDLSWSQAVEAVKNKTADMFASVARTAQREAYSVFTKPYISMPIRIFARQNSTYIGSIEMLQGKRIAVSSGYAIEDWLKSDHPELNLIPVASPSEGLSMVDQGSVDAFIGNAVTANYYLGKLGLDNIRVMGDTPYANEQAMAVRDDWPILAGILQKALAALPQQEHRFIYNRWLSIKFEHSLDYELMWRLSLGALFLLFAILYWNRRLSTEVGQRQRAEADLRDYQQSLESEVEKRTIALQTSESRLREAQHMARIGSWTLDMRTQELTWSEEIFEIFELEQSEFAPSYELFLNSIHPDDRDQVNQAFRQSVEEKQPYDITHRLIMADGRIKYVHERGITSYDDDTNSLQTSGTVQDITEMALAQQQLRQAATVYNSTAEGVLITDLVGNIIDVNPAFKEITGYDPEQASGQNASMLSSGRHDNIFYQTMWHSLEEAGLWRGEIWNRKKNGSIYPELLAISAVRDEHGTPTGYVGVFSDISALKQTEERLAHLAHHDSLTGLPNRLLLHSQLEQSIKRCVRNKTRLALVFIDLDRFKNINDSLGHPVGDELLKQLAERLRSVVREGDTVARIGGDEFVILLEDIENAENASVALDKLIQSLKPAFQVNDHEIRITTSMGVSLYPGDGEDAAVLLRNSDAAMYRAKDNGRNNYQFYTEDLTEVAFEHVFLENALRGALEANQFKLLYQPQINLESGEYCGMEALIRWHHPDQGIISPDRFIPVAEQSGLIWDIGQWVLRTACLQGKAWLDQGINIGKIAVNVAVPQLQHGDFLDMVKDVLRDTGFSTHHLALEVTEGFAMLSTEVNIELLESLRSLEIEVAIDDFGTGYSSLSYLKKLSIDKLKIDQSFVRDIPNDSDDMAIANAVIALSKAMNLKVIAEGVETDEQVAFLKKQGCDEAQGYYYSRPVTASEIEQLFMIQSDSDTE